LTDRTTVPLKSVVGVTINPPVVVACGPNVPVALTLGDVTPPKETVIVPAVRPVMV